MIVEAKSSLPHQNQTWSDMTIATDVYRLAPPKTICSCSIQTMSPSIVFSSAAQEVGGISCCTNQPPTRTMKRRRRSGDKAFVSILVLLASKQTTSSTSTGSSAFAFTFPTASKSRCPLQNPNTRLGASISAVNTEHSTHSTSLFNVGYDADGILDYYDKRPWEVGLRLNMLGLPLLGWYLGLLTDNMMKMDKSEDVQRKRGAELRNHLVRSRSVALIKSGQALSLRPDLLKSKIWAEELGKLVDEVGAFSDIDAMNIMSSELSDLLPRLKGVTTNKSTASKGRRTRLQRLVESDPILSLFEFYNDFKAVASASIGQVYKARLKRGPALEAILGKAEAAKWGGKTVAIKIQRPDVAASAALDMYLIRRTAMWLSKFRGGDVVAIADTFGMQLFGELDYVREAKNCERFRELYGGWEDVVVPPACTSLTRKRVLIMEWVEGTKGPWMGSDGIEMVRIGLRCATDQLLRTGLFHAGE